MKKILVPTDFSENAMHALRYACMLNSAFNGKIILFHSYEVPIFASNVPYVVMPDDEDLKTESLESLNKQKHQVLAEYMRMDIETSVEEGFAENAITQATQNKNVDLLVMGTQGASGLREALIGSITAAVMEDASCPVIAVPEKANVSKLNRIVFATDYAMNDFENINKVTELAKPFDAEIVLLHISSGELDQAFEFGAIEKFKERISAENKYDKVSFKLLESRDVLYGLNFYLDEINADLLAMSMRHRTFFRKLFNRSKTKKMAFHTHIPLLAFHSEE